jgi:hypothetical protein
MQFRVASMRTVQSKQPRHDGIVAVDPALDVIECSTRVFIVIVVTIGGGFITATGIIYRCVEVVPPRSRKVIDGFVRIKFNPQASELRRVLSSTAVRPQFDMTFIGPNSAGGWGDQITEHCYPGA